jgi:hypothetical protein
MTTVAETFMGCDIHVYTEEKIDDAWVNTGGIEDTSHYDEEGQYPQPCARSVGMDRDYWMFAFLAKVRGEYTFSFDAKGLPEDVSIDVGNADKGWDSDGHTHSYLTKAELEEKRASLILEPTSPEISHTFKALKTVLALFSDSEYEQRIVFWFDN